MKNVLIFGATSAIAQAVARRYASRGDSLYLVALEADRVRAVAEDLAATYQVRCLYAVADLTHFSEHAALIAKAKEFLGGRIDVVLMAHGVLGVQEKAILNFELTRQLFEINLLSPISLLTHLANEMERQGSGVIGVIASVAGMRGRQSNYVYGAAKGGLRIFLSGLRNRLVAKGVQVLTIDPGFVDTPMTREFKKGLLWASPQRVGDDIVRALDARKDVLFTPWFWRWIMLIITHIPERIFKKLKL